VVKFITNEGGKPDSKAFGVALRSYVNKYDIEIFSALKNGGATINQGDLKRFLFNYEPYQRLEILQLACQDTLELFTMALECRCISKAYLKSLVESGVELSDAYLRLAVQHRCYLATEFLVHHNAPTEQTIENYNVEDGKRIRYAMQHNRFA
jgi:hypothetical protein